MAQPYYAGPPIVEKLDTAISENPFYTGQATEEEEDAVFDEDNLDMDFFVMGMDMKMDRDWAAKSKSISTQADLEAELFEDLVTYRSGSLRSLPFLRSQKTTRRILVLAIAFP